MPGREGKPSRPGGVSRSDFLARTAKGSAVLAIGGATFGTLAPRAAAAVPDADLVQARLAVASELLAIQFYRRATGARLFKGHALSSLKRALFNEREHYSAVARILTDAGQTAAKPEDFDYSFPHGAFASVGAAAKLGLTLESTFLGIYLGGVGTLENADLKETFARIAASEAEHMTLFSQLLHKRPAGASFPEPIDIATASTILDRYLG